MGTFILRMRKRCNMFRTGAFLLGFSLMLGVAPAWADVDISQMQKVEVGSWGELKAAVEDSANAGKVIVLTEDIQADKKNQLLALVVLVSLSMAAAIPSPVKKELQKDSLLVLILLAKQQI